MGGTYLFGAPLLFKVNVSAKARTRGRLVLNGAMEICGSFGEISASYLPFAKAIWLQALVGHPHHITAIDAENRGFQIVDTIHYRNH